MSLVHKAAVNGNLNRVKALVNAGENVNGRSRYNMTGLMAASGEGHLNVVKYLVEHGANVNARGVEGVTALMIAAQEGYLAIVKYLVEHGANVNARTHDGQTALVFATVKTGHLAIVKYLVEHGANVSQHEINRARNRPNIFQYLQGRTFNWNSRGNLIPFPNKAKNNVDPFTLNKYKSNVPYVQVTLPGTNSKFYVNKNAFKEWYTKHRTPFMGRNLTNRNLKIVRFEKPAMNWNKPN